MKGWLKQNNWWKGLAVVMVLGLSGVAFMGVRAYQDAPPIPDFVDPDGNQIVSSSEVLDGQSVFQKYALMDYGSMFGDGAARGPDYTAEALHEIALSMQSYYQARSEAGTLASMPDELSVSGAIESQVKAELKRNTYAIDTNQVTLTHAQAAAFEALVSYYTEVFSGDHPESIKPHRVITDRFELRQLTAFFFWGAWVCAAQRPEQQTSYTHNWPFDETAGNTPGPAVLLWSVIGSLALFLALGIVLYLHGRIRDRAGYLAGGDPTIKASPETVNGYQPSPTQRATYKFFAVAAVLFACQVLVGILTVHDFVNFTNFFGIEVREGAPITMVRSLHLQFALFWIAACWIAGSIFILPFLTKVEPRGQKTLVNILFWMIVVLVGGTTFGIVFGPSGLFGEDWRLFGHQGWEFVELGKVWQALMMACFVFWGVIVFRGVWPAVRAREPWTLPNMLLCAIGAIVLFFSAGFVAGPRTNFVIADFWRWCVIHMWAEAFFEVFTTIVVAYFMVLMGLVSKQVAARIVYLATILFLGSGLLGISHNFYWNAKPVETLALGSVFSTMQVIPLMLLTVEAWRFRNLPRESLLARAAAGGSKGAPVAVVNGPLTDRFAHNEAFLFLIGVNFWNFLGAGVFGFIINLPIVNYYEHGTYLTVNHGHAALMGVYGNLSIAAMIFVGRYLIRGDRHNGTLLRIVFWSLNIGLMLMVLLDLFPAGVAQLDVVLNEGLWKARSQQFIEGATFQTFTWMRVIGGAIFTVGGVIPLVVYMVTRLRTLKPAGSATFGAASDMTIIETDSPAATGEGETDPADDTV